MASPLSFFRKHQYVALVAVGVLAIVSFVIIPPIDEYLRSRSGVGGPQRQAVVVTWSQGRVREMDLRNMETNHHLTMNFLDAMAEEVRRRDGQPKAMRLFRNSSEQALIATMLLAEKAQQLGVVISDAAIHDYLDRFADGLFDHRDLNDILRSSTGGRLTRVSLFKQLRHELLAHYMRQMVFTGVAASTPAADFQHFNQLRERMTLELLPLPVSDFMASVEKQPTETDVRQLYEAHRDDYKSPMRAEPGFRRLPKIDFAYFKVDFSTFLEQEKENITEAEILREYEAGKQSGEYRRSSRPTRDSGQFPDIPGFPSFAPDGEEFPVEPEGLPEDLPESDPDETDEAPESAETEQSAAPPESELPENNESVENENTENADRDADRDSAAPESPADEPAPEPDPSDEESERAGAGAGAGEGENEDDCALFFQVDESADDEETPTSDADESDADPVTEDSASDEPASDEPDSEPSSEESPVEPSEEGESPEPDQPDAEVPAEEEGTEETPEEEETPAEEEALEEEEAPDEEPVSEFLPLEEVRDQILRKLASPAAQQRLEEATNEARAELEGYFQTYTIWKQQIEFARSERDREPEPTPPDFAALAGRLGFTYGRTGLVDVFEVSDTELGETARFDAMTRSIRSFAQIAFDDDVPLFRVREIGSNVQSGVDFLYWKADEQDEHTPPLEEIRLEVEEAWKMLEARKLAEERAKELQKLAAERPGPLKDSLTDYADQVFQTNEFTWLTAGNIGFNPFAQPTLGNVEGVEGVSWEFMESVFQLSEEEVGTVRNGPEDTYFVARVVRRAPADERQRQEFLQAFRMGGLQDIFPLQQDEQRAYYQQWFQDLEAEMNVTWERPADQLTR